VEINIQEYTQALESINQHQKRIDLHHPPQLCQEVEGLTEQKQQLCTSFDKIGKQIVSMGDQIIDMR
jgi:hypothetical protein